MRELQRDGATSSEVARSRPASAGFHSELRPEEAMEVRPVRPDQFDEVYPVFELFANSRMSRDDWRRMLFDLPWPVEEEHRGFALYDGGQVVGFVGTIFSRRRLFGTTQRFCNLTSWIVKETHRQASLQLMRPIHELRAYTISALTSTAAAHQVYARLGFQPLEPGQVLLPPFAEPAELLRAVGVSVTTQHDRIARDLDEDGRAILDHMSGTLARQALVRRGRRRCHVVAVGSAWKRRWKLAHVLYTSDWDLFWDHPGLVSLAFRRTLGTVGLRVDARHMRAQRPALCVQRALPVARQYRPADPRVTPQLFDGLYTELVGLRW
jgi:hypothetical protein